MVNVRNWLKTISCEGLSANATSYPGGGKDWTGVKTCVSGTCCQFVNDFYSQCLQGNCGGQPSSSSSRLPTSTTTSANPGQTGGAVTKSPGCGKSPISSGTKSISVNGQNRQYVVRVPNNYDSNKAYRIIFAFHWRGGSMNDVSSGGTDGAAWAYYGQQRVGQESAILVAPNGFGGGWANSNGEDVAFVDAMLTELDNNLCVNQQQRFSIGFSYGGAMSYSLACSRANKFRGVAVISGAQLSGCSGGTSPVAYLGIHGVSDNVLNIGSGRGLRDKFVQNNGCTKINPSEPAAGSGRHVKTDYSGCRAGYPVTWLAFDGGHDPGPVDGASPSGARSYVPGEIYSFFNKLN